MIIKDHRGVKAEEHTKRKSYPLDHDPRKEPIKLHLMVRALNFQHWRHWIDLVWGGGNLLYLKVVGDPKSQVAQNQEGHHLKVEIVLLQLYSWFPALLLLHYLPSWFCLPVLIIDTFVLQVSDEEKLQVDLCSKDLFGFPNSPKRIPAIFGKPWKPVLRGCLWISKQ